jgi:hypothetical protein
VLTITRTSALINEFLDHDPDRLIARRLWKRDHPAIKNPDQMKVGAGYQYLDHVKNANIEELLNEYDDEDRDFRKLVTEKQRITAEEAPDVIKSQTTYNRRKALAFREQLGTISKGNGNTPKS